MHSSGTPGGNIGADENKSGRQYSDQPLSCGGAYSAFSATAARQARMNRFSGTGGILTMRAECWKRAALRSDRKTAMSPAPPEEEGVFGSRNALSPSSACWP